MGERLLTAVAIILATVCEILDVSCRYIKGKFAIFRR
jgi:GGDEF domain-containing protein